MAEVSAFFHAAGTPRAIVQIAPSVLPEDWEEIAAKVGLTAGSHWAKLACDVDVALARTVETDLRVGPVSAADGPEWASAMLTTFGMDGKYAPMVEASVERPGWTAFAAWLDDQIVTTGQVFVRGDTGQCFGGATKPEARRRGGQSAVLQARARVAKAQGCRWLVSETGAEQPGEHNSSLHNMYRLGFELLYERQNWIWSPSQD
jgi:GNAT superfamily N-acetyltransferase